MEEQLKECEKHKKEVEDKINEIMITHLNISRTEIEKLTNVGKLDTILNTIKQEVKECLKLLGISFQTGDSLMSMLKKLVKACKEIEITGPVQDINPLSVKTMVENMFKLIDPESEKMFNRKIWKNIIKKEYDLFSTFNPNYNYINVMVKDLGYYLWGLPKYEDETFLDKIYRCHKYLQIEINSEYIEDGTNDMSVDNLFEPNSLIVYKNRRNGIPSYQGKPSTPEELQEIVGSGELDRIQGIINTLKQENQDLKNTNDNLKKENENLKTTNDGLKQENEELKNQIKPLNDKIHDLEEENKKIKAENDEHTKENLQYEETLKTLNANINNTISMFNVKYNANDSIEKRIEQIMGLVKAMTNISEP
ncbi:37091_t:CDS:2 [Racocetra persica]|uniref:37091_t:CDS:1 n=1 Tax=Racocetra persica TaxID=160502 RepID=A0ACA9NBL5_9GLOM|nr:37091_t:CDS:2 [Racocetra persica]